MFHIKVSDEILQHSQYQVDHYDFGKRYFANGDKEQQLTGVIGQSIIMNMFDQGYVDGSKGCDDGTDIDLDGCSIDVKTMGRTVRPQPGYVNNYMACQAKFKTQVLIFCSYNKKNNELTVCGWIPKEDFLKKATFCKKGTPRLRRNGTSFFVKADMYEIENFKIYDVFSAEELIEQISLWWHTHKH